jgi:plasmid stabilization system protein ParE
MARVVFAEVADADMDFVVAELAAEGGTSVALKYQAKFKKLYDRLEAFPQSGAPRRRLGAGIRIGVVRPYTKGH